MLTERFCWASSVAIKSNKNNNINYRDDFISLGLENFVVFSLIHNLNMYNKHYH